MSAAKKFDIFISYRRAGGSALGQLVHHHLTKMGYRVFMDVRDLQAGEFDKALKQQIQLATDVVVLITPDCFDRCAKPDDWFRIEIEDALAGKCNVLPLRVEEAQLPEADELPDSIARITKHQCVTFNSEYMEAGMQRLSRLLKAKPRRSRAFPLISAIGIAVLLIATVAIGMVINQTPSVPETTEVGLIWHAFGQRERDGVWKEFPIHDGATIYNGDQLKLVFRPTVDSHVYIVRINSQDIPSVLFPQSRTERENRCSGGKIYSIPEGDDWISLDDKPGEESIFMFVSSKQVGEIESIIDSHSDAYVQQAAQAIRNLSLKILEQTRGASNPSEQFKATVTLTSGNFVEQEMSLVSGDKNCVQVVSLVNKPDEPIVVENPHLQIVLEIGPHEVWGAVVNPNVPIINVPRPENVGRLGFSGPALEDGVLTASAANAAEQLAKRLSTEHGVPEDQIRWFAAPGVEPNSSAGLTFPYEKMVAEDRMEKLRGWLLIITSEEITSEDSEPAIAYFGPAKVEIAGLSRAIGNSAEHVAYQEFPGVGKWSNRIAVLGEDANKICRDDFAILIDNAEKATPTRSGRPLIVVGDPIDHLMDALDFSKKFSRGILVLKDLPSELDSIATNAKDRCQNGTDSPKLERATDLVSASLLKWTYPALESTKVIIVRGGGRGWIFQSLTEEMKTP